MNQNNIDFHKLSFGVMIAGLVALAISVLGFFATDAMQKQNNEFNITQMEKFIELGKNDTNVTLLPMPFTMANGYNTYDTRDYVISSYQQVSYDYQTYLNKNDFDRFMYRYSPFTQLFIFSVIALFAGVGGMINFRSHKVKKSENSLFV